MFRMKPFHQRRLRTALKIAIVLTIVLQSWQFLASAAFPQNKTLLNTDNSSINDNRESKYVVNKLSKQAISLKQQCLDSHNVKQRPTNHTADGFILQPSGACSGRFLVVICVQSAIHHRYRRDLIRKTWASVRNIAGHRLLTLFFVGRSLAESEMKSLASEAADENDIVQAEFIDTYRNLTLKHLYALHWLRINCNNVKFVMKVDDDVTVNVFHLFTLLQDKMLNHQKSIMCSGGHTKPIRDKRSKWYVSKKDYPDDNYPRYCPGVGYIFTFDLVPLMHFCAQWRDTFWIDDVFVTGILIKALNAKLISWDSIWNFKKMDSRFLGPDAGSVLIVMMPSNSVLPMVQLRLWQSIVKYSAGVSAAL